MRALYTKLHAKSFRDCDIGMQAEVTKVMLPGKYLARSHLAGGKPKIMSGDKQCGLLSR